MKSGYVSSVCQNATRGKIGELGSAHGVVGLGRLGF